MKKYNIARIAAVFFGLCMIITIKYFDNEAATLFMIFTIIAYATSIWYFKTNQ